MDTITRKRGDTYSIFLELTDEEDVPLDINGTSAVLSVNTEREPLTNDYQFQVNGVAFGVTTDGVYEFPISDVQSDNLGKFYYDIQFTDSGGKKRTIQDGVLIFKQDISK